MMRIKIALLSILILCIAVPAFGADTVRAYDTVVHYDTTYLYDTTLVVQRQLSEMKSEFYDKAIQSLDDKQSSVNIMLTIIAIFIALIAIVVGYMTYLMQRSREAADREVREIRERRVAIDKVYDEIMTREARVKQSMTETEGMLERIVAGAEKKAREEAITSPEARIKLISELDAKRSTDEYEKLLLEMALLAIPRDRLPTSLLKNVGFNYFTLEKYDKALDELLPYAKVEPRDPEGLFFVARCFDGLYHYATASQWYRAVITADQNNYMGYNYWAFNNLGVDLLQLFGERKDASLLQEAIAMFEKAVEIDDRLDLAYYNWGLVLAKLHEVDEQPSFLDKAIAKFKKAIQISNKNHVYYNDLGIALLRMWRHQPDTNLLNDAKAMALKAMEIAPERKDHNYNLACAESLFENRPAMLKALELAIEYDTKFKKMARDDKDFEKYRGDPNFIALTKED